MERLKRFNEVHGTVAGNATEELAAKEAAVEFPEADVEPAHGEEGCAQLEEPADADAEEEKDEVYSQYL